MDRNFGFRLRLCDSPVALRKESVDRNVFSDNAGHDFRRVALRKESVDRNMTCPPRGTVSRNVALRKESVDRNIDILHDVLANCCRSPQGERG